MPLRLAAAGRASLAALQAVRHCHGRGALAGQPCLGASRLSKLLLSTCLGATSRRVDGSVGVVCATH